MLPAKTTQEVMLSNKNANAKQFYCQAMLMLSNGKKCQAILNNANTKHCYNAKQC